MTPLAVGEMRALPLTTTPCERLTISTHAAARAARDPRMIQFAHRLGSPERANEFIYSYFTHERHATFFDLVADPFAVLSARGGDCLTLCTLLLAILRVLGCDARLVWLVLEGTPGGPPPTEDHVIVYLGDDTYADPMTSAQLVKMPQLPRFSQIIVGPW